MSAQEIIERIKAMPPEEQQEVANFVREIKPSSVEAKVPAKRRPDWDRIIEEVFDEHDELFRKLAQ